MECQIFIKGFEFLFTLIEWVKSEDMRLFRRHGSGRQSTSKESRSVLWILSRQSSWREGIFFDIQPMWTCKQGRIVEIVSAPKIVLMSTTVKYFLLTWVPVATKSLLSLWPHVRAVTALWKWKIFLDTEILSSSEVLKWCLRESVFFKASDFSTLNLSFHSLFMLKERGQCCLMKLELTL